MCADCISTHSLSCTASRAGLERPAPDERAAKRTRRSPVMEETGPQSSASEDMVRIHLLQVTSDCADVIFKIVLSLISSR